MGVLVDRARARLVEGLVRLDLETDDGTVQLRLALTRHRALRLVRAVNAALAEYDDAPPAPLHGQAGRSTG